MTETPVMFGISNSLVGVLTRPDQHSSAGIACLLPNAGLIHRVGPHRLGVKLARALAGRGLTTLRLDLAGVGDSKATADAAPYREQVTRDLKAAMDHIEATCGISRFVVFGICSGAVNGFWTAVADPRIVGLLMFDGFWYRSRWTTLVRLWKRWRALGTGEMAQSVRRTLQTLGAEGPDEGSVFGSWDMANPPHAEFTRHMNAMHQRGVSVYMLYGGTVLQFYSYQNQFRDAFAGAAFLNGVRCELHPDIDHTLITLGAQRKLTGLVCDWASSIATATETAAQAA